MTTINVFGAVSDTEETLAECWCDFDTYDGGNDKDNDSRIELKYSIKYSATGITRVIALAPTESHGRFADGTPARVSMPVQGIVRLIDVAGSPGTFTLNFEPKGDDTWKFHYALRMRFNQGTLLEVKSGRFKEVSDQSRQLQE